MGVILLKVRAITAIFLVLSAMFVLIAGTTSATFSDQVVSSGNTFSAGTLYMAVDGDCTGRQYGGGGVGGPGVDGNTGCSMVATFSAGPIAPGEAPVGHTYSIVNQGSVPGTLSASVSPTVDADHPGCTTGDWSFTSGPLSATALEANGGATDSATFPVSVALLPTAPNACQGAELTVDVTFDLVQA
jgi:predicted ribosomally synthesized peptide with SipW-like signal peptide